MIEPCVSNLAVILSGADCYSKHGVVMRRNVPRERALEVVDHLRRVKGGEGDGLAALSEEGDGRRRTRRPQRATWRGPSALRALGGKLQPA